jgi:virulence factor Mce-like protein
MMPQTKPLGPRVVAMVLFALSCFGILLFLWISFGGPIPLKPKGYRVQATFRDPVLIPQESEVRISGVNVGRITKVDKTAEGGIDATIQIKPRYAPIPRDVKAVLRQKTLLGEVYIELTPGNRSAGIIHDGGRIPTSSISPTVELDEIFRLFDAKTRSSFQTWMQGQAVALGGRGAQINDAIGSFPGFESSSTELLRILNAQDNAVSGLVANTGTVFGALSERDKQLADLITNGQRATKAFADRNQELAETFKALPAFERESKKTVERLTKTAVAGNEAVTIARPAAREFAPAFNEVKAIGPDFKGLLASLDDLTNAGRRGQPAFQRTTARFQRFFATLPQPLNHLNPILQLLKEHRLDFMSFMINVTAATQAQSIPRGNVTPKKYLRLMTMLAPEELSLYEHRLPTNRANPYAPQGRAREVYDSRNCSDKPWPTLTYGPGLPDDIVDGVKKYALNDGTPVAPPCILQKPRNGTTYPRLPATRPSKSGGTTP